MQKFFLVIMLLEFIVLMCMGCVNNTSTVNSQSYSSNSETEFEFVKYDSSSGISEYKDTETGVHYIIYDSGHGSSMCPRYNADGTLCVD